MNKTKRTNTAIYLLISGGVLLVIVAFILVSQRSNAVATSEPTPANNDHEDETYPEISRINIEDAKAAWNSGTAVFLDVRDADAFEASRITGAENIPLADLPSHLDELEQNKWIIPYCT